jgi:hypothetical protein
MKKIILLFLIYFTCKLSAQDTNYIYVKPAPQIQKEPARYDSKNAVYLELLGSTYGIGVSYERKILSAPFLSLNARVGVGTLVLVNAVPTFGLNALIGKEKHFLELGFNATRTYGIDLFSIQGNITWIGNPILGYRFISENGFVFRFSFTPLVNAFSSDLGYDFFPFGGISFGKAF